jgi:hypothetical protein
MMSKLSIAHIINPVIVDRDSDLSVAQPVTFETMRRARNFAKKEVKVKQFAAFFPEDEKMVPKGFKKTRSLNRSVLDVKTFTHKRKLPLIRDILGRLYEKSKADYFIYTNVDIALMPYFYLTVKQIIEQGYDGFVIFRRTLGEKYHSISQVPMMYADYGEKHTGHDCFVFRRDVYKKFILGQACIGARKIARIIMSNMIAYAQNYTEFTDLHMTFHIGNEEKWQQNDSNDYYYHNVSELMKISKMLLERGNIVNREKLVEFFRFNISQIHKTAANYPETAYLETVPESDKI